MYGRTNGVVKSAPRKRPILLDTLDDACGAKLEPIEKPQGLLAIGSVVLDEKSIAVLQFSKLRGQSYES